MNILHKRISLMLQQMEHELQGWIEMAPFLVDEDVIHVKIRERVRVMVALQQALLESIVEQLENDRENLKSST